ncbi:MAG TPA: HAD family phosphatase [Prolixibacteraceae bacterium]|nr:HAD family phosphatase [Prolixibacteraceae bacterium]
MGTQEIINAINKYSKEDKTAFNLKAIFFDMDGVLFNSMPLHADAWLKTFSDYGLILPEHEPYMNEGSTAVYTIDKMYRKYQNRTVAPEVIEEIKQDKHSYMASLPKPGIIENMPEFVNYIAANNLDRWVVTGSAQHNLINRINTEYNDNFDRDKMVTAHDVKIGKPNPEPYLMALKKSGYQTNEAIVIENAPLGVESAKAAGLFTIAINTGPLSPDVLRNAGADIVLDDSVSLFNMREVLINTMQACITTP